MKNSFDIFIRSILAGICIGLGGAIFIKLGGVIGACMFTFGLLTVVHFKLPLYTGTAGFIKLNKFKEYEKMIIILFGNILGCILLSYMNIKGIDGSNIIQSRLDTSYLQCLLNAIGCGLIMTLIVQGGRDKNLLLILFGIPLFILLGFYHSIADAFYMMVTPEELRNIFFGRYWTIVLGNFIGCNIPRLLKYNQN
jgi:formate/nitrite transporter FocA (FNT family)